MNCRQHQRKMNGEEVSAFSVYSTLKKPKSLSPQKKLKKKLKKKKKSQENNVNSIMSTLIKTMEDSKSSNKNKKTEKSKSKINERKSLIKEILKEKEESIFKDCIVTSKADNLFFTENGFSDKGSDEKSGSGVGFITKPKKPPKKKSAVNEKKNSETKEQKKHTKKVEGIMNFNKNTNGGSSPQENGDFVKSDKKNKRKKLSEDNSIIYSDSVKLGEEVFSWLVSPLSMKDFFENCWEKKPLHIKHNNEEYFKCICSLEDFKRALSENDMYFTKNIDITSYINGERQTENPEGKAKLSTVWDFYKKGRSVRLLNPQTFIPNIRIMNTILQEFFHCFVGANIYLTPPGTQGFAPHYDDIEAFVLQLEGEKHWKLYNPRSPEEILPRESSRNFNENEIGEPILEVTLQPGDILYFPRGIIHQAKCLPHVHSLHVTVSCYQKNSWADLLEKVLPVALQSAINENVEFRKGLPLGYLNSFGLVYSDNDSYQRNEMKKKFNQLFGKILEYCPLDAGVDQLGANFIYDALPPWITEVEKNYGGDRNCKMENFKEVLIKCKNKKLNVKLIRATSVRLVSEEEEMCLYYTTDNSLVYHEQECCSATISTEWAQAIDYLIRSYPKFVPLKELPVSNNINKPSKWKRIVEFVYFLWQKGLILFDQPLTQLKNS